MKKKIFIGLGIFFTLIIVAITSVVIYFWPYISSVDWSIVTLSNIKALYRGLTEDPEVTNAKIKDLDDKRSEEIKSYVNVEIREYTEEELAQIESGEKTKTEIVAQIIAESVKEKNEQNNPESQLKPDESVESSDKTEVAPPKNEQGDNALQTKPENTVTADEIVARYVASLYELHGNFESRVATLANNARNWLHAYKKAHPGITWRDAKAAAVQHYTSTATQIEADCYGQVDALIESLKAELKSIGADLSIVKTIKESAYSEMDARKAKIIQEGTAKMNK